MRDQSKSGPQPDAPKDATLEKIIRKLAAEAREINLDAKAPARRNWRKRLLEDDIQFDYTPENSAPDWNDRIDVNLSRERRTYPRKSCFLSVDYATDDRAYQEFIQDISTSGAFIETRYPLPIGQNIAMTFSLPSRQENIKLTGSVTRTTPSGLGVAFTLKNLEQKNYLSAHIAAM